MHDDPLQWPPLTSWAPCAHQPTGAHRTNVVESKKKKDRRQMSNCPTLASNFKNKITLDADFFECRIMVGGASVHISKHSLFRLKITVGCRLCTSCKKCHTVHTNIQSANASKIPAFNHDLRANFKLFSHCFQFYVFELVFIQSQLRSFLQCFCCHVCQFAITFNTIL